jgi:putative Holliday junction resolvase
LQGSKPRILCLDVGDKRIGIALSDPLGFTAQPQGYYTRVGYGPDVRHIAGLVERHGVGLVLCGLPRNMDGSAGGQAEKVKAFAAQLEQAGLAVAFWDERLSSVSAERVLIQGGVRRADRRGKTDSLAAAIILQAYLDAGAPAQTHNDSIGEEDTRMDEQNNIVELMDEEGNLLHLLHLMTLQHEGAEYVVLTDDLAEEDEAAEGDESEVFILQIAQDEQGEDCYVAVEDEDVSQAVFERFMELYEQEDEE